MPPVPAPAPLVDFVLGLIESTISGFLVALLVWRLGLDAGRRPAKNVVTLTL